MLTRRTPVRVPSCRRPRQPQKVRAPQMAWGQKAPVATGHPPREMRPALAPCPSPRRYRMAMAPACPGRLVSHPQAQVTFAAPHRRDPHRHSPARKALARSRWAVAMAMCTTSRTWPRAAPARCQWRPERAGCRSYDRFRCQRVCQHQRHAAGDQGALDGGWPDGAWRRLRAQRRHVLALRRRGGDTAPALSRRPQR